MRSGTKGGGRKRLSTLPNERDQDGSDTPLRTPRVVKYGFENQSDEASGTPDAAGVLTTVEKTQTTLTTVELGGNTIRKLEDEMNSPVRAQSPKIKEEFQHQVPSYPVLQQTYTQRTEYYVQEVRRDVLFWPKWIGWHLVAAVYGLASLIIYFDVHLLSRHSKRRGAITSTIAAILSVLLLSTFLVDRTRTRSTLPTDGSLSPDQFVSRDDFDYQLKAIQREIEELKKNGQKLNDIAKQQESTKKGVDSLEERIKTSEDLLNKLSSLVDTKPEGVSIDEVKKIIDNAPLNGPLSDQMDRLQKRLEELANAQTKQSDTTTKDTQTHEPRNLSENELKDIQDTIYNNLKKDMAAQVYKQVEETFKVTGEPLTRNMVEQLVKENTQKIPLDGKSGGVSYDDIMRLIEDRINLLYADDIGKADYALGSSGATIIESRTSPTYTKPSGSIYAYFAGDPYNAPQTILSRDVTVGNCWAFAGSRGYVTIRLSAPIQPTEFTLEHIPSSISYNDISSAPKDFFVYGLTSDTDNKPVLLGTYTYNKEGKPIQTFKAQTQSEEAFPIINLSVSSNYGNPEYTCVYRFRVHGQPPKEELVVR